ncbi:MAG: protein phosphatase 2C domain-containing protein [Candidatus Pedobacter colombiensis]|uniref:Protein phosphatase 2C domain-containing protein n=1 Tax=Candidatus Pedobacter colombiensis TaxID=3121371 RepID=A0AAJ5WDV1_9SPHI|nr:protein phosphatase 2C domain-containing protein [Pedobacter sp.]WEK21700.1 MAG: protein phosphatase 2C domain-containing protein [Pedobacter sp.]
MDRNYFGITDTGKLRSNNEDTFIAERIAGTEFVLACVIDGVGGYTGGEVAAAIARDTILKLIDKPGGDLSLLMQSAITEANDQILAAKQENKEYEDMACVLTVALADLKNNQFHYAHVGDTRLYLLRDSSLIKISKDQSFVGFMEDSGRLTEEQAMQHPKRNEINKALGFAGNIGVQEDYIETGNSPFLPGDVILLCSDGLSDMVNKQTITDVLLKDTELEEKGIELIDAANQNGGLDNITIVLVKNNKAAFVHEVTKPAARPKKDKILPAITETTTPQEKTTEQQVETVKTEQSIQNKATPISPLLIFIAFVVLAAITYFLWKQSSGDTNNEPHPKVDSTLYAKNAQALKLQDTLNKLTGNILILDDSVFKSPILISEPIKITRDSLYLKASGKITLKSDSGYKGQPFLIEATNKSVLLENFTLENFDTVSALQRKGVLLKNVQFIRTDAPAVKPNK